MKIAKMPLFGDSGSHIVEFQKALKDKGFSPGSIDGIFGGKTREAASKFQKSIGLTGTGIPGPKTISSLGLEISEQADVNPVSSLPSLNVKTNRTLPGALEALIDQWVEKNALERFKLCLREKDFGSLMVICGEALDSMSIREKTGSNDGYLVELMQKVAGGRRGYAWCMYAVECHVAWVEKKTGVVSKMPTSGSCADVRARAPKAIQVEKSKSAPGDVWIWRYTSTGLGHTGVFKEWKKPLSVAYLYEGNTTKGLGPDGKVNREGGGFYRTERAYEMSGMTLAMVVRAF